jgi:hypothetical protein
MKPRFSPAAAAASALALASAAGAQARRIMENAEVNVRLVDAPFLGKLRDIARDGAKTAEERIIEIGQALTREIAARAAGGESTARETPWRPILAFNPDPPRVVVAACKDGRRMAWPSPLLAQNLEGPTPDMLAFPADYFMELEELPMDLLEAKRLGEAAEVIDGPR